MRQLVLGQARRVAAAGRRRRRRASRRGSWRPGRSRSRPPGPRGGRPRPRCRPAGGPRARAASSTRRVGLDRRRDPGARPRRGAGPAELRGLGQPVERLRRPGELHDPGLGRHEVEQRSEERGLAGPLVLAGHQQRDARLDQQPDRRRQLGIERAATDQLDDGARFRWNGANGPPAPRGGGVGHGDSTGAGWMGRTGSVRPGPRSVKRSPGRGISPLVTEPAIRGRSPGRRRDRALACVRPQAVVPVVRLDSKTRTGRRRDPGIDRRRRDVPV